MFQLGIHLIRRMVEDGQLLPWHTAKLSKQLFKGTEQEVYAYVQDFVHKHHALPTIGTLEKAFPEVAEFTTPEPSSYYLDLTLNRFAYDRINAANLASQDALKEDKTAVLKAETILRECVQSIAEQRLRNQVIEASKEMPKLMLDAYHDKLDFGTPLEFGWPYLDQMNGGAIAGDVISFVGRPQQGKTFQMLWSAIHNWRKGRKVLVVSMEMSALALCQRVAAMYAHTNLTQLKNKAFSKATYLKFEGAMVSMKGEPGELYIIDGNLTMYVDEIFELAAMYGCEGVWIDGAYLMRHRNPRLDRYTRVAENVEDTKKATTELKVPTFASWQFAKSASKKDKAKGEKITMDDIGYSDAIAQISSVVLGLLQEDGVESAIKKIIDVLKGRGGEIGKFEINWDFGKMDFNQVAAPGFEDHGDKWAGAGGDLVDV